MRESNWRSQRRAGEHRYFRVDTSCFPQGLFKKIKTWTRDLLVRRLCHICCGNDPVNIHTDSKNTHKHIHTWKHSLTAHLFSVCLWPSPLHLLCIHTTLSRVEFNVYSSRPGRPSASPYTEWIFLFLPCVLSFDPDLSPSFFCFFSLNCWKTQMAEPGFEQTRIFQAPLHCNNTAANKK